ncbi:MAG: hypothetical protein AB8F95_05595 [Bacteroidia bacterium]
MNHSQNISSRQYILEALERLPDAALREIASFIRQKEEPTEEVDDTYLMSLVKPIRKKTDIEALVKEQGFRSISSEEWDEMLKGFESDESLEDLLAQLD